MRLFSGGNEVTCRGGRIDQCFTDPAARKREMLRLLQAVPEARGDTLVLVPLSGEIYAGPAGCMTEAQAKALTRRLANYWLLPGGGPRGNVNLRNFHWSGAAASAWALRSLCISIRRKPIWAV